MTNPKEQLALRLPDGLRDRIKAEATRNRRSMNAEVIIQLERLYPSKVTDVQSDGREA